MNRKLGKTELEYLYIEKNLSSIKIAEKTQTVNDSVKKVRNHKKEYPK